MQDHGFEVILVSSEGEDWKKMPHLDRFEHHKLNMERRIAVKNDLRSLIEMVKLLRRLRPDIVHTHTPKAGLIGMMAAWIAGVPTRIHTLAGMPAMTATGTKRKILLEAERMTYKFATEVWINSKFLRQFVLDKKLIDPQKAVMILNGSSNGIDLQRYSKASLNEDRLLEFQQQYSTDANFTFLAVGRMVKDKGIIELIEAFDQISQQRKDIRLLLLGPFEQADALPENIIQRINDHPQIQHVSWSDEVEYFMAMADCFVHASHREGFPNVILQAASMGLPVICSDIPGNIDIVEHDNEGYVYPVKNSPALRSAMEQVLNNKEEAGKKARSLQDKVRIYYDRRAVHAAIRDRYIELLRKKEQDVSSVAQAVI